MTDKYPRTYHFPFSPGKGSDDKVLHNWEEALKDKTLIYTEKLDGGNTQITKDGVFARSVSLPTNHPSFDHLKAKWATIRYDLENYIIFGENMFAIHSLEYSKLDSYFYVFSAKYKDTWLSWKDVKELAEWIEYPTAPVLEHDLNKTIEQNILEFMNHESALGGPKEGIVVRNADSFENHNFSNNVIKYVRENHVQTDEHWTKSWKQAKLV
jgi:hypothetical protein